MNIVEIKKQCRKECDLNTSIEEAYLAGYNRAVVDYEMSRIRALQSNDQSNSTTFYNRDNQNT